MKYCLVLSLAGLLLSGCQVQGLSWQGVVQPEFELEVTEVSKLKQMLRVGVPVQLDFRQVSDLLSPSAQTRFTLLTPEMGTLNGNVFEPQKPGIVRFLANIEGVGERIVELEIIGDDILFTPVPTDNSVLPVETLPIKNPENPDSLSSDKASLGNSEAAGTVDIQDTPSNNPTDLTETAGSSSSASINISELRLNISSRFLTEIGQTRQINPIFISDSGQEISPDGLKIEWFTSRPEDVSIQDGIVKAEVGLGFSEVFAKISGTNIESAKLVIDVTDPNFFSAGSSGNDNADEGHNLEVDVSF